MELHFCIRGGNFPYTSSMEVDGGMDNPVFSILNGIDAGFFSPLMDAAFDIVLI